MGRARRAVFGAWLGLTLASLFTVTDLASAGETMDEAAIEDFATRYTAAWCSQEPERVAAFFAENGSLTINDGEPSVGRAAIAEAARGFMTAFPDMVVSMDGLERAGDGWVYRWTLDGGNTGPGGTGRRIHISGYEEWTMGADGLIAQSLGHFDAAEYERQLAEGSLAADDEAEIRSEIEGYRRAWNAGDADALASYYLEDADRTNNSGDVFRGRAAIRDHYGRAFSRALPAGAERSLTYHEVGVRVVSPDAAVVDVSYEVIGIRAEVSFPVRGRNTVFMIKREGRWMRAAHRNSLRISADCLKLCNASDLLSER